MFESSLLSYTLAHPGKLGRNISSPSGNAPIKRQAMDSIYLRSIDPSNGTRTRWAPIDYHDRMTVKECERKMKNIPTTQIRFISCRTRFVLMAAYDKSKSSVVEKIIGTYQALQVSPCFLPILGREQTSTKKENSCWKPLSVANFATSYHQQPYSPSRARERNARTLTFNMMTSPLPCQKTQVKR